MVFIFYYIVYTVSTVLDYSCNLINIIITHEVHFKSIVNLFFSRHKKVKFIRADFSKDNIALFLLKSVRCRGQLNKLKS